MRYRCAKCGLPPVHNEKLGITFCRKHGFSTVPVIAGKHRNGRNV